MSHWGVYSFLKQAYLYNGKEPTVKELILAFPGVEPEELLEGMQEFRSVKDKL